MSTSLLYHGFGVRGIEFQRMEYRQGTVHFFVVLKQAICVAPPVEKLI